MDLTQEGWHDLSYNLTVKLLRYSDHPKFGQDFNRAFDRYFPESNVRNPAAFGEMERSLFYEYFVHLYRMESSGESIVGQYLNEHRLDVSPEERELLQNRVASRFSLFEVQKVDRGKGLLLKDLFQDDTIYVHEVSGSRNMYKWDVIVGNIFKVGDEHQLSGNIMLVPRKLVEKVQSSLLDEYRIYQEEGGQLEFQSFLKDRAYLIRDWITTASETPPSLVNKEGDPLVFGIARYRITNRSQILDELAGNPMFEVGEPMEDALVVNWFLRGEIAEDLGYAPEESNSSSLFATLRFTGDEMQVDVNSEPRMDLAKQYLDEIFENKISFIDEEFQQPEDLSSEAALGSDELPQPSISSEVEKELQEVLQRYETDYYFEDWIYQQIPALGGLTPVEAYTQAPGKLEELLKTIENQMSRAEKPATTVDIHELTEYIASLAEPVLDPELEQYYDELSESLGTALEIMATDLFQISPDQSLSGSEKLAVGQIIAFREGKEFRLAYIDQLDDDQVWVSLFEREPHRVPRENIVAALDEKQQQIVDGFVDDFITQQELTLKGMAQYNLGDNEQAINTFSILFQVILQMEDQIFYIVDEMSTREVYFDLDFEAGKTHFIPKSNLLLLNLPEICAGVAGMDESLEKIRTEVTKEEGSVGSRIAFLCIYFAAIVLYSHQNHKRLRNPSAPAFRGILDHLNQKKYDDIRDTIKPLIDTMKELKESHLRELSQHIKNELVESEE